MDEQEENDKKVMLKYIIIPNVNDKEEFIKKVNYINEENVTLKEFVNCYNIETLSNLNEVVKEHSFVLKTSGLCEFKKSSHNEQKRKTIQTQI